MTTEQTDLGESNSRVPHNTARLRKQGEQFKQTEEKPQAPNGGSPQWGAADA